MTRPLGARSGSEALDLVSITAGVAEGLLVCFAAGAMSSNRSSRSSLGEGGELSALGAGGRGSSSAGGGGSANID